jgi:hypothetical protein
VFPTALKTHLMKPFLLLILSAALMSSGCGRKKSQDSPEAAPTNAAPAAEAQPVPGSIPPPAATPDPGANPPPAQAAGEQQLVGAVHGFMTQQLRLFVQQKGRLPQDFAEFASARMDSVPRPPEGFRWAVDNSTVQVKLVR